MGPDLEEHDETKLQQQQSPAPGRPGVEPKWETGAKTAVGTAVSSRSRVWFTIANGYLNEIYFPDVDRANTRAIRFLVADDNGFFSDEVTGAEHSVAAAAAGIPTYSITSRCKQNRYLLRKEIVTDCDRDALLMRVNFEASTELNHARLYVFVNSHLGDEGEDNNGWVGEYKGIRMLFAENQGLALAIASSTGFAEMSCGYMGISDGLTDLSAHCNLTRHYTIAERGNVALIGRANLSGGEEFALALAFGGRPAEAALQARAALVRPFDQVRAQYSAGWQEVQSAVCDLAPDDDNGLFRISVAVACIHESKRFPGAFVASLSTPWGFARGDKDVGGYHVIWPRDLSQTALGLLASGDSDSARRALFYLACTQDADGHWNQNQWLDGTKHWTSKQMDETASPILLADALRRADQLRDYDPWPMVTKAVAYIVQNGPAADEDRWEGVAGYAVYTMAVEIAALLAAAKLADERGQADEAEFLRETADAWNDSIDELTYVSGTQLARDCGADGYYVRVMPREAIRGVPLQTLSIDLTNHPRGQKSHRAADVVSPDALALVRWGLRASDDPRMLNTIKVIDATLKKMTATGPIWHRYTDDGYGERVDGAPFKKSGIGRGWPLLSLERAHYELANKNMSEAEELRRAVQRQTSVCGLIPEQVWDAADIPERGLYNGRPSGSGMPLVWAHAEYMQLVRSLHDGEVWNAPLQTIERYVQERKTATFQIWTPGQQRGIVARGKDLRIDLRNAATIEWTVDCWKTVQRSETRNCGFGLHCALLTLSGACGAAEVRFRIMPETGRSETKDFVVGIGA